MLPGSNLTQVPILKEGMLPFCALLKIVIRDTAKISASCSAVIAWSICSIRSARDSGTCTPLVFLTVAARQRSLWPWIDAMIPFPNSNKEGPSTGFA